MPATIKEGSIGTDVATWQEDLKKAGYSVVVSGDFDAETTKQTKAWQAANGLVADGIVGPMSWSKMTGVTTAVKTDPRDKEGREALLAAWKDVTGEEPSLAELQITGANGKLESGYGHSTYKLLNHADGSTIASSGTIWNWGAIQGGSAADGTGFLATDTSPLKVTADNPKGYYDHHYRIYPNSAEGAKAIIKEMTVRRPASWAIMKTGDIDAWAEAMHAGYDSNGKLKKDPISGVPGYFEQKPSERAKGIATHIASISATMGEPIAAKRGGPVAPGEVVQSPGGTDESGILGGEPFEWTEDTTKKVVGAGVLASLALAAYRILSGGWPWPGKFPF